MLSFKTTAYGIPGTAKLSEEILQELQNIFNPEAKV
jgi:hypothetical protein